MTLLVFSFKQCHFYCLIFVKFNVIRVVILVIYMNDILVINNNISSIVEIKNYMKKKFYTKDLGQLRYFLDIEVAKNKQGLIFSRCKYTQDLLPAC